MSTIASVTLHPATPAPARSRGGAHAATAPREPIQVEHRTAPASVGIALAWVAFFAIAMGHSLATSHPDARPRAAQIAAPR